MIAAEKPGRDARLGAVWRQREVKASTAFADVLMGATFSRHNSNFTGFTHFPELNGVNIISFHKRKRFNM